MNAAPAYRPALGLARVRPFGLLVGANDNAPLPPRAALALARFVILDGCDGSPPESARRTRAPPVSVSAIAGHRPRDGRVDHGALRRRP